jgi:predicted metal-binding protein
MQLLKVKTKNNEFNIEYYHNFIRKKDIGIRKDFFNNMCKDGCINYGKKYSCPPLVPNINSLIHETRGLYVILFKSNPNQINSTEYNKVRIANGVMKSRIIKLMKSLETEFNTVFLSTGSCNLCKSCKLKLNLPCKYPDKRRYSLEAVGVDCNKLCEKLFRTKLLWYKNKKAPEYTCVLCGLVCNKNDKELIEKRLNELIKTFK